MSFLVGGGKGAFDRLLDSATSQVLLEPNWATNLEICDSIRQNDVNAKYAVTAIRKKIKDPNPHVSKFGLIVLETCVKNCGQTFHEEMATHDFMDDLRTLAQTGSAPVKEQILSMLQAWNHAFRNKTQFQPILATYNLMKMEGYQFPPLNESDAMFSADAAPAWKDGDTCHMCRVKFSTFTRQHHCRACGEVFCSKCSSKQSIIPKIGIEREVRVCDHCYNEINPSDGKSEAIGAAGKQENENELPLEYLNSDLAKEAQTKPKISDAEAKAHEEEEMQLALALSLSEEEANKSSTKSWGTLSSTEKKIYEPLKPSLKSLEPKTTAFSNVSNSLRNIDQEDTSEMSRYLDRSYWEKKNAENKAREPSAPVHVHEMQYADEAVSNDSDEEERSVDSSAFITTMEKSIKMFVDRMNNVRLKGKHIAMDSTVQSLFQSLSAMHPQLIKLIEDEEESKVKYEAMLQKLAIIREARESLNDMRAQHQEKVRHQELEQEMLRRMQMEQKLELMRQQKQEYLEYQRQLQIQRQQELEIYQQDKLRQKQVQNLTGGNFPDPQMSAGHYQYSNQTVNTPAYMQIGQISQPGYEIPNQQYTSLGSSDPTIQAYPAQTSVYQQQPQQQQHLQQQNRDYYQGPDQQLPNQQQTLNKQAFPNHHTSAPQHQQQMPQQQMVQNNQLFSHQQSAPESSGQQVTLQHQVTPQKHHHQLYPQGHQHQNHMLGPQVQQSQQMTYQLPSGHQQMVGVPQQQQSQQGPQLHQPQQQSPQAPQHQLQQQNPHVSQHQLQQPNPQVPQHQPQQQSPQAPQHQLQQQNPHVNQHQLQQPNPQVPQHQPQQQNPHVPQQQQASIHDQQQFNMHQYPSPQYNSSQQTPAMNQLYPDGQSQYNPVQISQPYPSQQEQQIYTQQRGYPGEPYQQPPVYQPQPPYTPQPMHQVQSNSNPVQEISGNMKDLQLISFD